MGRNNLGRLFHQLVPFVLSSLRQTYDGYLKFPRSITPSVDTIAYIESIAIGQVWITFLSNKGVYLWHEISNYILMKPKSTIKVCACFRRFVVTNKCTEICPWCLALRLFGRPIVDLRSAVSADCQPV